MRCTPAAAATCTFSAELPDLAPSLRSTKAEQHPDPDTDPKVALEPLRDGASAVLAAETGSGKTLAFLVPTLQRALETDASVLVLAPTRELATQLAPDAASLVGESAVQLIVVEPATVQKPSKKRESSSPTPKEAKQAFETYSLLAEKASRLSAIVLRPSRCLCCSQQKTDSSSAVQGASEGPRQEATVEASTCTARRRRRAVFVLSAMPTRHCRSSPPPRPLLGRRATRYGRRCEAIRTEDGPPTRSRCSSGGRQSGVSAFCGRAFCREAQICLCGEERCSQDYREKNQ